MRNAFRRVVAATTLALTAAAFAAKAPDVRFDVSSEPEGAQVTVDGSLKGTAPIVLTDLEPGSHLVRVSAPGFRPADEFVSLSRGDVLRKHYALDPEKGLLLVATDPAGAEVRRNGVSLGTTPLLLTDLDSGATHALELVLNGYRAKRIDVRLEDRTPVVRRETLESDSGTLDCTSEPSGATVIVNGVERGVTPLTVSGIPKGLASVTFRSEGYQPETRELRFVPGERQTLSLTLRGKAARLAVVSTPEGARVCVDDDYQGKTPVNVETLPPGMHTVRVELPGCAPVTRTVALPNGGELTEEFRLDSVLGRVEIVTTPPGAKVMIDGHAKGVTRRRAGAARSETFAIENVDVGEHSLVLHADGFLEFSRKIKVEPKKTLTVNARLKKLFVPDTEVETSHGVFQGVLVSQSDVGVTLEIRPGVEQVFPKADIRKVSAISAK